MKYQDLVIKDGKFIGEFEKMYQLFDDPWNQTKTDYVENSISRQAVCTYIKKYGIKSLVEVGCGLGKTSNFIFENTKANITGIDISNTSIEKAKQNYPYINFKADTVANISNYSDLECIYFAEVTWYMLEDNLLDKVFKDIKANFAGKYFIHNLSFYKGTQKYGTEYFTNLDQFIKFTPFQLLAKLESDIVESDSIATSSIFLI